MENTIKYIEYAKYISVILTACGVAVNPDLVNAILVVGGGLYGVLGLIKQKLTTKASK